MKFTIATAALAVALTAAVPAHADQIARPTAHRGGWVYIGTTHAQHMNDHDTIIVTGRHDNFRALQLRVTDAPLHMRRMRVTYDNGAQEDLPVRFNIPKNGMSRAIDLRGGRRSIHQVDFWYDTKGWLKGTANVTLYGMH